MANQNEPPGGKFDSLQALQGDRKAVEAVCRQHWPKEGAIQTTARRGSAIACAIVVLRALLGTVPLDLRADSVWTMGSHPLFNAARVPGGEESMRLAATATQLDTEQIDFLAIMESPLFVNKSSWIILCKGQLFYVPPQAWVGVNKAEAQRRQRADKKLSGIYASRGMLVIKPSNGDDDNPKMLHDAVQQAYKKVLAAAPPQASSRCWGAPKFIRPQYDGRMRFEKPCFTLDVAGRIQRSNGHVHTYPTKRFYYQCIAAVCLTSELHTHLVPVADDHGPADPTDDAQLRSQIEGEFRDRMAEALQAANEENFLALSTAQEAHRNELQDLQDNLREQAAARKLDVDSITKERDELGRQLSDANTDIAAQTSEAKRLQQQLNTNQLLHDGTVDVPSKIY
ncbi:hypothetical protein B0T18DRAFT_431673 [Schizothecium vesticola]|uniref:Uncharacterized protein n=1 Tax=Schizothecium vesticola TaxID=314040 RepID=A0AA40EJ82_9PEZI|nr:hypothetical protein B0T18DRAFT_431673 [Schizothecium vesticola]